jgi:hypothetical protein
MDLTFSTDSETLALTDCIIMSPAMDCTEARVRVRKQGAQKVYKWGRFNARKKHDDTAELAAFGVESFLAQLLRVAFERLANILALVVHAASEVSYCKHALSTQNQDNENDIRYSKHVTRD